MCECVLTADECVSVYLQQGQYVSVYLQQCVTQYVSVYLQQCNTVCECVLTAG